jgi:gas vesicle protein
MGKSGKFMFGALLGAAAAALLTPVAGKKARKKVAETAEKAGVDKEKIEQVKKQAKELGGELLDKAKEVAKERAASNDTNSKTKK